MGAFIGTEHGSPSHSGESSTSIEGFPELSLHLTDYRVNDVVDQDGTNIGRISIF